MIQMPKILTDLLQSKAYPLHPNCQCTIEEIDLATPTTSVAKTKKESIAEKFKTMNTLETKENQNEKQISEKGLEFLKQMEGSVKSENKHVIYDDKTGRPINNPNGPLPPGATIGYGHLIQKGEDFSKGLTEKEATELFKKDLSDTYKIITNQISKNTLSEMPQNKFDALVSLVFNIGPGSSAPNNANRGLYQSSVRKYLNNSNQKNKNYSSLENAWRAFRNQGILDKRRDAEWRLFENSDYKGYK